MGAILLWVRSGATKAPDVGPCGCPGDAVITQGRSRRNFCGAGVRFWTPNLGFDGQLVEFGGILMGFGEV